MSGLLGGGKAGVGSHRRKREFLENRTKSFKKSNVYADSYEKRKINNFVKKPPKGKFKLNPKPKNEQVSKPLKKKRRVKPVVWIILFIIITWVLEYFF